MPLSLGDASTERPHIISFDPASPTETKEAEAAVKYQEERGFTVEKKSYGEVLMRPPARNPNLGLLRVLSTSGDDRIVWDRTKRDQVRDAYQRFKEYGQKGYTAYACLFSGKRGPRIEDFDPGLQEILLIPPGMPH